MIITRRSPISNLKHSMDINITQDEFNSLIKTPFKWYHPTKSIQKAFPNLSASEREFIMTGITVSEWEEIF